MNIGIIGLGKMGYNLCLNMRDNNFDVTAYNRSEDKLNKIKAEGVKTANTIEELIDSLNTPRVLWFMITSGPALDTLFEQVSSLLSEGDIIIDGGNSYYKDTVRRGELLNSKKINYIDVGTSGGIRIVVVGWIKLDLLVMKPKENEDIV